MPAAIEIRLIAIILVGLLWFGSDIFSWHEGAERQFNADRLSWQKRLDASQAALDKANADADAKTKANQDKIDVLNNSLKAVSDENQKDKSRIAEYQSGARKLYVSLSSCRSALPSATNGGQSGSAGSAQASIGVVDPQAAGRLDADVAEHNALVRQLVIAQGLVRAAYLPKTQVADSGPLP